MTTETGGILLGYRTGDSWLVVESIDPGPASIFQVAYFEYDQPYVTHLANRIARLYKPQLEVLGLWHRHPGSFDRFSGTDDGTNTDYAALHPMGALSGLVNIDPAPRFTLFHVAQPLAYQRVPFRVLTHEESIALAPLTSADYLSRELENRNRRVIEEPMRSAHSNASSLSADQLSEQVTVRLHAELKKMGESERAACAQTVRAIAKWTDDDVASAVNAIAKDAERLARRGVTVAARMSDAGELVVLATDAKRTVSLGSLGVLLHERGDANRYTFTSHDGIATVPWSTGLIAG